MCVWGVQVFSPGPCVLSGSQSPRGNYRVGPAGVLPSALSTSLHEAFRICHCLCLLNSGFHQDSVSSWKARVFSALSCTVGTGVYFSSITLGNHFESKGWTAIHKHYTVKASLSCLWKPEKSKVLWKAFLLSSHLLCRPWNGSEVLSWRGICHSLSRGWVLLAWWPHYSRPECPESSVFWWVCCWSQRSESRPVLFECTGVDHGAESLKLQHFETLEPEFAGCMPLWLGPWALAFGQPHVCVGTLLWVYPSPNSRPAPTKGENGAVLSSHCLRNTYWPSSNVLGAMEKNKGKLFLAHPPH